MSAKKCAREECGKTVYPIEELKCLDKVWHKQCFKCTVCGMTLSMKNYKGYDKKPYCEPHYPKTVASVVTDTPEMRRLAENTKNQSQVKYHEDYEKMRGTRIQIADDPEMARHLANSRVQSQAQYHGELEKKLNQDSHRPRDEAGGGGSDGQSSNASSTLGLSSQSAINDLSYYASHSRQGSSSGNGQLQPQANGYYTAGNGHYSHQPAGYDQHQLAHQRMTHSMVASNVDFGRANHSTGQGHAGHLGYQSPYANGGGPTAVPMSMSQSVYTTPPPSQPANGRQLTTASDSPADRLAERLAAVTSPSGDGLSPYSQRLANQQAGTIVFSSEANGRVPTQERKIGSIADYDPMNGQWGGSGAQTAAGTARSLQKSPAGGVISPAKKAAPTKAGKGIIVKALYDYTAADTDEVSFLENDIIVNCEKVDDGWMTGTVQRTLQYGMLPANYVERVNAPTGLHRLH